MEKIQRFDVGNGRELIEWLVSLDEPGSEDRKTVTLNQIIEKAKATLTDVPWQEK